MSDEKEETPQDTIYTVPGGTSAESSKAIREAVTELEETSAEARKDITIHRLATRKVSVKKVIAKTTLSGLENLDTLAGAFSYACLVVCYEFVRQGNFVNAVLFGVGAALSWILKHRLPSGPVASFLHAPVDQIKVSLIDLSRTIYHK